MGHCKSKQNVMICSNISNAERFFFLMVILDSMTAICLKKKSWDSGMFGGVTILKYEQSSNINISRSASGAVTV